MDLGTNATGPWPSVAIPAARIEHVDGITFFCVEARLPNGDAWTVWRRYSDFLELRRLLLASPQLPQAQAVSFPPRLLFACSGQQLEVRRLGLERWLRAALRGPPSPSLRSFLGMGSRCTEPLAGDDHAGCEAVSGGNDECVPDAAEPGNDEGEPPAGDSDVVLVGEEADQDDGGEASEGDLDPMATMPPTGRRSPYFRPASWSLPGVLVSPLASRRGTAPPLPLRTAPSRSFVLDEELRERVESHDEEGFAECARLISRDIPRTFHGNPKVDQVRLRAAEVLRCHAKRDPELGYTQGMCFAAAAVCLRCDSLDAASAAFGDLMGQLRGLWLPGFPLVVQSMPVFEALLAQRDPEVLAHLGQLGIELDMVLPKAWLTVLARWLPLPSLLEVLPFLTREGLQGLLAMTLLLLLYHRDRLLGCKSLEEVLRYLGELPSTQPPERLLDMSAVALPALRARLQPLVA